MFVNILKKYIDLIKRLDPREDDEVTVQRFDHFNDILDADEKILWQGAPSPRHAWGDHDQMESAGSVGDRPVSLTGRVVEMILALVFIFFMFLFGAGSFYVGIGEIVQSKDILLGIFLILTGCTFMSGLAFLLRPLSNCLRARKLTYLLTTSRAMIVRRGHAWAEIWVRSPVILFVSALFIYSVIMFGGLYIEGVYLGIVHGAGWNSWLARGLMLIFILPLGAIFAAIGYVGLRFQFAIIIDAIKGRHDIFVRSFSFSEIRGNDLPVFETKLNAESCPETTIQSLVEAIVMYQVYSHTLSKLERREMHA